MYHDVHGSPKAGFPPMAGSWSPVRAIHAVERFVARLATAYECRRRRRAAIRDLQRFDDHILRDLGIERSQIAEVAEGQVARYHRR